jgi:hypothetical protein
MRGQADMDMGHARASAPQLLSVPGMGAMQWHMHQHDHESHAMGVRNRVDVIRYNYITVQ